MNRFLMLVLLILFVGCQQGDGNENATNDVALKNGIFEKTFSVNGRHILRLSGIKGVVRIMRGADSQIVFRISGSKNLVSELVCNRTNSTVQLEAKSSAYRQDISTSISVSGTGNVVVSNGGEVVSVNGKTIRIEELKKRGVDLSKGISIKQSNGRTILNGVDISESVEEDSGRPLEPLTVDIYVPKGCACNISDVEKLQVDVDLGEVVLEASSNSESVLQSVKKLDLTLSGNGKARVKSALESTITASANADATIESVQGHFEAAISGAADLKVDSLIGGLTLVSSGSSTCEVRGNFSEIDITLSGSTSLKTFGQVSGNYHVNVFGSSDLRHSGRILGNKNVEKSRSGTVVFE